MANTLSKWRASFSCLVVVSLMLVLPVSCTRELTDCGGPPVDLQKISAIKKTLFSAGPRAALVVPNPIDTREATKVYTLADLSDPESLESSFIKIRLHSLQDDRSVLAHPNSAGEYSFSISDPHYSEVMGYYSVTAIMKYVEAIGFPTVKTRPLYVVVRDQEKEGSQVVNATYAHNYLSPSLPRVLRLYGDTAFAPGIDRDMYWHEFGHLNNESVSREIGFDFATEMGAVYTEGSALHECLADAIMQSLGDKSFIGKWIARNLQGFAVGAPLRSAVDTAQSVLDFPSVAQNDGRGAKPERYEVAEWCTRVLWDIRAQFVKEDEKGGAVFYDRLFLTALSLTSKDTSFREFYGSMLKADEELYCGFHQRSIRNAFEQRGFKESPPTLSQPLTLQARAVGVQATQSGEQTATVTPGMELAFVFVLSNPNSEVARNVRLILESRSSTLHPTLYMQGFGDLRPGQSISVGDTGFGLDYSVRGEVDRDTSRGRAIRYRLRVLTDNGPETIRDGEINL